MKPRFRLWHLFAFTTLVAAAAFVASHIGFFIEWQPETPKTARHFQIFVWWNGNEAFDYDSWPPPDAPPPPPAVASRP